MSIPLPGNRRRRPSSFVSEICHFSGLGVLCVNFASNRGGKGVRKLISLKGTKLVFTRDNKMKISVGALARAPPGGPLSHRDDRK